MNFAFDLHRFELLSAFGAGLGCLVYAALLFQRPPRRRVQTRLALLLFAVGQAFTLRALDELVGGVWFARGQIVGFVLFPLFAGLFAETLFRRHLPFAIKLLLLLGTGFFGSTLWFAFAHEQAWWALGLMAYQGVVLVFLYVRAALTWSKTPPGPERTFLTSLLVGVLPVLALYATDWLPRFGVSGVPRLSALPVLLFLYLVVSAILASGRFRFATSLLRLSLAALVSGLLACVIAFARGARGLEVLDAQAALVLLFAFLLVDPLVRAFEERQVRSTSTLLERLHDLPRGTRAELIAALARWPEIERVELYDVDRQRSDGLDRLAGLFRNQAGVLSRDSAWVSALATERVVVEQLEMLFRTTGTDTAVRVGDEGDVLIARFVPTLEVRVYGRALKLVSALLERSAP